MYNRYVFVDITKTYSFSFCIDIDDCKGQCLHGATCLVSVITLYFAITCNLSLKL